MDVKQNMEIISTKSLVCIVAPCIKLFKISVGVPDKAFADPVTPRSIKFLNFRAARKRIFGGG
jgi:hypothetical protein